MLSGRRQLGSSDLYVSRLCLGGNVFGWAVGEDESQTILDAYVAAGGNFLDTADLYSAWVPGNRGGESEAIIGRWLRSRRNRDHLVVGTKVGQLPGCEGLSAAVIRRGIDASLRRLGLDHVDIYFAHIDDPDTDQLESLGAFDEVVKSGKVRYVAASNHSVARLESALALSRECSLVQYVGVQVHYNLVHRDEYEGDLAKLCAEQGLACMPYWALASGFLSGKYRGAVATGARAEEVKGYLTPRGLRVLAALDNVAASVGAPLSSVALAWLMSKPTVTAPVASATSVAQLRELVEGVSLALTEDDLGTLEVASGKGTR